MNAVLAVTQANDKQFAALTKRAKELGATTAFTASQVAAGMKFLGQAGFTTDEILSSIGDTLNLAAAGNLELARAADIASNIMRGFNLNASESQRAVDVLAFAASNANTNISQMGEAMKFLAPVAANLGISIEASATAVAKLGDAGIQASLAGTNLRTGLTRLLQPQDEVRAKFSQFFKEIRGGSGEIDSFIDIVAAMRRANLTTADTLEIFGRRAAGAFLILQSEGVKSLTEFEAKMRLAEGITEKMRLQMEKGLPGALKETASAFESIQIEFTQAIEEPFNRFLRKTVAPLLREFGLFIQQNKELIQVGISKFFESIVTIGKTVATVVFQIGLGFANIVDNVSKLNQTAKFNELQRQLRTVKDKIEEVDEELKAATKGTETWNLSWKGLAPTFTVNTQKIKELNKESQELRELSGKIVKLMDQEAKKFGEANIGATSLADTLRKLRAIEAKTKEERAEAIKLTNIFKEAIVRLVAVGEEEVGVDVELDKILRKIAISRAAVNEEMSKGEKRARASFKALFELGAVEKSLDKNIKAQIKTMEESIKVQKSRREEFLKMPVTINNMSLAMDEFFGGVKEGFRDLIPTMQDFADFGKALITNFASESSRALSDSFFAIIKGDTDNLGDIWKRMLDTMLKQFLDFVAQLLVRWAIVQAAGVFGFNVGGSGGFNISGGGGQQQNSVSQAIDLVKTGKQIFDFFSGGTSLATSAQLGGATVGSGLASGGAATTLGAGTTGALTTSTGGIVAASGGAGGAGFIAASGALAGETALTTSAISGLGVETGFATAATVGAETATTGLTAAIGGAAGAMALFAGVAIAAFLIIQAEAKKEKNTPSSSAAGNLSAAVTNLIGVNEATALGNFQLPGGIKAPADFNKFDAAIVSFFSQEGNDGIAALKRIQDLQTGVLGTLTPQQAVQQVAEELGLETEADRKRAEELLDSSSQTGNFFKARTGRNRGFIRRIGEGVDDEAVLSIGHPESIRALSTALERAGARGEGPSVINNIVINLSDISIAAGENLSELADQLSEEIGIRLSDSRRTALRS